MVVYVQFFFFFKQKTAYEMRISDWSSDVCSSDLAFRTISEVSDELDVPQHVLRFWEGKYSQVRPLKRGGGRRYYRPEDIDLLRRIRDLLYSEGYTIKGVQRLLREGRGKDAEAQESAPAPAAAVPAAKPADRKSTRLNSSH